MGIEGIGETTATTLLVKFKSVKRIKEATVAELNEHIDLKKAQNVYQHFH